MIPPQKNTKTTLDWTHRNPVLCSTRVPRAPQRVAPVGTPIARGLGLGVEPGAGAELAHGEAQPGSEGGRQEVEAPKMAKGENSEELALRRVFLMFCTYIPTLHECVSLENISLCLRRDPANDGFVRYSGGNLEIYAIYIYIYIYICDIPS